MSVHSAKRLQLHAHTDWNSVRCLHSVVLAAGAGLEAFDSEVKASEELDVFLSVLLTFFVQL